MKMYDRIFFLTLQVQAVAAQNRCTILHLLRDTMLNRPADEQGFRRVFFGRWQALHLVRRKGTPHALPTPAQPCLMGPEHFF